MARIDFRHKVPLRVRWAEVDSQSVVFNGHYLLYADVCVTEYWRTIGLRYPDARRHNLYAVSWMHNLEYALQRGLDAYVAGWTDPQVKAQLGARFTFTRHAVYARSALLRALLRRLHGSFERDRAWRASPGATP